MRETNERQDSYDVIGIRDRLNFWVYTVDNKFIEHL